MGLIQSGFFVLLKHYLTVIVFGLCRVATIYFLSVGRKGEDGVAQLTSKSIHFSYIFYAHLTHLSVSFTKCDGSDVMPPSRASCPIAHPGGRLGDVWGRDLLGVRIVNQSRSGCIWCLHYRFPCVCFHWVCRDLFSRFWLGRCGA